MIDWLKTELLAVRDIARAVWSPGPPPHGLGITLSINAALLLMAWGAILFTSDNWNRSFKENAPGTYLSVFYLAANAICCQWIARTLAPNASLSWRWCHTAVTLGFFLMPIIVLGMLKSGEWLHEREHHFFKGDHGGRKFWRFIGGTYLVAFFCWWRLGVHSFGRFWLGFGGLLAFAAVDDLGGLHEDFSERLTRREWGLPADHFLSVHLNDLLVTFYAVAALLLFWPYRRSLVRLPWMLRVIFVALAAFGVSQTGDFSHWPTWIEESFKVLAGASILAALLTARLELSEQSGRNSPTRAP